MSPKCLISPDIHQEFHILRYQECTARCTNVSTDTSTNHGATKSIIKVDANLEISNLAGLLCTSRNHVTSIESMSLSVSPLK